MRFKVFVILVILVFCVYDFVYSHSGRTNPAGCHNVTATGGYHCHGGGSSSGSGGGSYSRSSRYDQNDSGIYLLLGITVIIGVGYWAYTTDWGKNPQGRGCLLSQGLNHQVLTRHLFNQTPMRTSVPLSSPKLPDLNLDRQGLSGWKLSAAYTFRF